MSSPAPRTRMHSFAMDPLSTNLQQIVPLDPGVKPYVWRQQDEPVLGGMLTGTDAAVTVRSIFNNAEHPPWHRLVMGKEGNSAGSVYVLNRAGERWLQVQKVRADDTDAYDLFGTSVSLYNQSFVVGAPSAGDPGVLEQQRILCAADGGTFTLSWRGHESQPIPFDADEEELKALLEAVYPIQEVAVDMSANPVSQVCDGARLQRTVITFVYPLEGDLEPLVMDSTLLNNSVAAVDASVQDDYVQGTRKLSGAGSSDGSTGAVYVFDYSPSAGKWEQAHKLMPAKAERTLGGEFGHDVALWEDTLVVGSPEARVDGVGNTGGVWVFLRANNTWSQHQALVPKDGSSFDKFGHAVAIFEDTLAVGAVGFENGDGRVYLYKRVAGFTSLFLADQKLLSPHLGATALPIHYGWDVSLHNMTLVVGAPGDISLHTNGHNQSTGLAYVYTRESFGQKYLHHSVLRPTPALALDRVGHAVAVWDDVVAVSSLEGSKARGQPRQEVQMIRTQAAGGATIGNTFRVGRTERQSADGLWRTVWTRAIESDALASTVRAVLMEDLGTGQIRVSRSAPNAEQGYRWFVTFQATSNPDALPRMLAKSELTGTGARVDVTVVNRAQLELRGQVYVFTRDVWSGPESAWTEQAVLSPHAPQARDWFGNAMALHESTVLVGAKNRDRFVSGVNSGSVFAFDLAFLNVRFADLALSITEGEAVVYADILRCDPTCHVAPTPPRNEHTFEEQLIQYTTASGNDWGVYRFVPQFNNGERIHRMPAIGRWDCRHQFSNGTDDCKWTPSDGDAFTLSTFDFAGEADFAHHATEVDASAPVTSMPVFVTDDTIVEVPDETLHLRLWSPGMQPTFGSDLWATVTIQDNGDGGVGARTYYEKLCVASGCGLLRCIGCRASGVCLPWRVVCLGLCLYAGTCVVPYPVTSRVVDTCVCVAGSTTDVRGRDMCLQPLTFVIVKCACSCACPSLCLPFLCALPIALVPPPPPPPLLYLSLSPLLAPLVHARSFTDDENPPAGARFGSSIEVNGTHAISGAPSEEVAGVRNAGAVYTLNRAFGMWDVEARLVAPSPSANDFFGSGVDISENWIVVGAVGGAYVSFFNRTGFDNVTDTSNWEHVTTLVPALAAGEGTVHASHRFGALHAVAIEGDVAAVGARNLETVFLFRYAADSQWYQAARLRASDYRQVSWLTASKQFRQHYGASVSLSRNTLVVGSPRANFGNYSGPRTYAEFEDIERHLAYYGTGAVYVYYLNRTVDMEEALSPVRNQSLDHLLYWPEGDDMVAHNQSVHLTQDAFGGIWTESNILLAPGGRPTDRFGEDVALDGHHLIVGAYGSPAQPETTWDFETGDLRGWIMTGSAFLDQPTYLDNTAHRAVYSSAFGPNPGQPSGYRGRYWVGTFEWRPANASFEDPTVAPWHYAGFHKGDEAQGTLSSEPFIIAGSTISFLVGGGCNIRLEYVELLVDNVPTLRATGECRETMRRVYWDVSAFRHRAGQIRIVDASSAGWAHINVDDFRFDWAMQAYSETPLSGAAYMFRRKAVGSEEPCEFMYNPLRCEWEAQGRLVAGDKRPGVKFGYSVDLDDTSGTAIVGAFLHTDVYDDWYNPGSSVGVRVGLDGLGTSFRADGGVNNGDIGGLQRTLYDAAGSPFLRNVGASAGGVTNSGAGGWDGRGGGNVLGGSGRTTSGRSGSSGRMFATRGTWDGKPDNRAFDQGNPFHPLSFVDRPQTGLVSHPHTRAGGGSHPNIRTGAVPPPTGIVYVYRRRPEERAGLEVLLKEPLWHVEQHSQLLVEAVKPGDHFGMDVAINQFTAFVGAPGDSTIEDAAGSVTALDVEYQRIRFEVKEYSVTENFHLGRVAIRVRGRGRCRFRWCCLCVLSVVRLRSGGAHEPVAACGCLWLLVLLVSA